MKLPFEGIRVADFTDQIAGSYGTMLLAACGAEVIRVESRLRSGFRQTGPFAKRGQRVSREKGRERAMSPVFAEFNRGKLSMSLNMSTPQGPELAKRLVRVSDVVIDNFRFGVMAKWGLDYPNLKEVKEDIIVVSLQPLGTTGPYRNWSTWGANLMSYTGFTYEWGHPDAPEPVGFQGVYLDYVAASQAACAVTAALLERQNSGKGQHIDLAQAEVGASLLGPIYLEHLVNSRTVPPRGNHHPELAPYNTYPCKGNDSWCVIAVSSEEEWDLLCEALGNPPWTEDPKFKNMAARVAHCDELDTNVERWTREHTPHQVMGILQAFGIAAGAVQNGEDLFYDLQLRGSGFLVQQDLPGIGAVTFPGMPVHLGNHPQLTPGRAPVLGEHNDYVYRDLLGLSSGEIDSLLRKQVIY